MRLALYERPDGAGPEPGALVLYDLARGAALPASARVEGPALVFALAEQAGEDAALAAEVELDPGTRWLARCDRVDFPPGGVAYRHVHPGPGIRRMLEGALTVERDGDARTYRAGEAWFEGAGDPVRATAWEKGPAAFVRLLLLPAEWAGRRTIRYLDPADEERPKLQRATILLEELLPR